MKIEGKPSKQGEYLESGYKAYKSYKDTGIVWLGKVPGNWDVLKIRNIFEVRNGSTPKSNQEEYWGGNIPWATPDDLSNETDDIIVETKRKITDKGLNSCGVSLAPKGSILLSSRAPIGHLGIAGTKITTNQGCKSLVFRNKDDNESYFYYLLKVAKNKLKSLGNGATYDELSARDLKTIRLPVPSTKEKQKIVKFLDRETSKIDRLIEKQEKLIDLLEEKRRSLISRTVTKGIGKNDLELFRTDWEIKVPKKWDAVPLQFWVDKPSKIGKDNEKLPYISLEDIEPKTGKLVDDFEWENKEAKGYRKFQQSDVLFGKLRPYLRKYYQTDRKGCCVNDLMVFRAKSSRVISEFLYYFFHSEFFITHAIANSYGTKMPRTSWQKLAPYKFRLPDIEEQKKIVNYLEKETEQIDRTIRKIKKGIKKLKEYRTALISAAVTGKIDVRGVDNKVGDKNG